MIEKIKAIHNPLTIIAIFAALAEIAGTAALAAVDLSIQHIFIWYVMIFPLVLVLLFFLTLNFNPKVLYAPSDFRDETNFLRIIAGGKRLATNLDAVEKQLDSVQKEIFAKRANEVERMHEVLEQQFEVLKSQIVEAKQSASELTLEATTDAMPHSSLQAQILALVSGAKRELTTSEIGAHLGMGPNAILKAIERLEKRGLLVHSGTGTTGWTIPE